MSQFKRNIVANFAGNIWQAFMALAFIPLYIKFMGIESYGLIGVFAMIQAMFGVLDMGLSTTLNREMASLSALPDRGQDMRNTVRTLEVIYWGVAFLVGMAVVAISPEVARHWLNAGTLPFETVAQAVMLMGCAVALQWPASFYSGGIRGLQRHVLLNAINIGMGTLRGGGVILVLWLISPTIQAFFLWQISIGALNTFLLAFLLWYQLPRSRQAAAFDGRLLVGVWRFTAGMTAITLSAMLLTQVDKIILTKMLSLEKFGYYTLAGVVAGGLGMIIAPIVNSVFPRFAELATLRDDLALKHLYHISTQLMALLILPVAVTLAFFPQEVLLAWTGSLHTAQNTSPIVRVLIIGSALNALMYLPSTLQLAYGWTGIGLKITLFLIVVLVPAIIMLTGYFGAVGAAWAWVSLNVIYMAMGVPLTHRRLLKGEAQAWFRDIAYPSISVLAVVLIGRAMFDGLAPSTTAVYFVIPAIFLCALLSAVASSPLIRGLVYMKLLGVKAT